MIRRALLALPLLAVLGACGATPPAPSPTPGPSPTPAPAPAPSPSGPFDLLNQLVHNLAAASVPDLQQAQKVATAGNDKPNMQCLAWAIPTAQAIQAGTLIPAIGTLPGPFTLFAEIRVGINSTSGGSGFLQDFNLNCAALINDVNITIAKFGLVAAGTAATGGAAAPGFGLIPGLLKGLPIPLN